MPVCPLEYRYGREVMKRIFEEENRLQKFLDVEGALALAHAKVGNIPVRDAERISKKCSTRFVKLERVKEIEKKTKHDIMAVVKALEEQCGSSGRYVHFGATSYDIVDTANALQFKDAIEILREGLRRLRSAILRLAKEHRDTVMLGRTHGQNATPITFGLKMAVYAMEVNRHIERLNEGEKRICVGKMSGAVGTGAALGSKALKIQNLVMRNLGIKPAEATTQIVQRDRYIEFISILANLSSSIEKFATEVRNLQRSEIMEVAESFDVRAQIGSSTMSHKMNPITCENICGLARVLRAFVTPAFENAIQWHERDLTNSSAERFIIAHACIIADDIVNKMADVFEGLVVYSDNMKRNLENTKGIVMAESLMMALSRKGMGRNKAHELTRKLSMKAMSESKSLRELALKNREIRRHLSIEEVDDALNYKKYLGVSGRIVDRVLKICDA